MLQKNNIEHVKENGDKKRIKNKNQENQCRKKTAKCSRRKQASANVEMNEIILKKKLRKEY